jgi:hypothetical protein
MHRTMPVLIFAAVVLLGLVPVSRAVTAHAQDATPTAGAMAGHPLVGTWILTDPNGTPSVTAFTSDGIVVETEIEGGVGVGSWQPTGERTAAVTFVVPIHEAGFEAIVVIRATGEVAADGATFTAEYSVTGQGPDGSVIFSDHGQVTGTRLPVEPVEAVGTPLAGFPTWTPSEEGTPEAATPTS